MRAVSVTSGLECGRRHAASGQLFDLIVTMPLTRDREAPADESRRRRGRGRRRRDHVGPSTKVTLQSLPILFRDVTSTPAS